MSFVGKTHFLPTGGYNRAAGIGYYEYAGGDPYLGVVGNVFFVSNGIGVDDAQHGYSPDAPFASIKFACTQCAPDNGDLILVLPNHTETIAGTQGMSTTGVTIRGLGVGRQRGTFTYSAVAGMLNLDNARTVIDNMTFVGTGAAVTQMVQIAAADCTIQNCEFEHANATNQAAAVIVTTTAANRFWINSNDFHGTANAGTNSCVQVVGGTDCEIYNNNFQGAYHASNGVVRVTTTATINMVINQNILQNSTTTNTKAIVDAVGGSTGQIRNNMMQILSGTAPITATAMSWVGQNYYANAVASAGTLI